MHEVIDNNLFMLKYLFKYCPSQFFAVLLKAVLSSSTPVINILYTRYLVNIVTESRSFDNIIFNSLLFLMWNISVIIINLIIQQLITPINTQRLHQKMQEEIFKKTVELNYSNYENASFFSKYNMALQQSDSRALAVLDSISTMISCLFGITALITLITSIEPIILLIVAINVAVCFSIHFKYSKIQHDFFMKKNEPQRESGYVQRIFYLREFAQDLRIYSSLHIILKNIFDNSISRIKSLYNTYARKNIKLLGISNAFNATLNTLVLLYLAIRAMQRILSIGDFTAGANSSQQLSNQILQLLNVFPQLYEHSLYIQNFREFMDLSTSIKSGAQILEKNTPITIEFKHVAFQYHDQSNYVLNNINLRINAGEKVAIVGANGAGKSTLTKLLTRLYEPSIGDIMLCDKPIESFSISSFRDNISVVNQDFQTYAFSIAENVLMRPVSNQEDEVLVNDALKIVGLYNKVSKLPEGIHTILSREFTNSGVMFSGGELQRLAIARTYAQDTSIVILDEPTSGLDPFSENRLLNGLLDPGSSRTVILISHRLSNIVGVDKIYFLKNGEILESGTHSDLMKQNGEYAKMFRLQADEYIAADAIEFCSHSEVY